MVFELTPITAMALLVALLGAVKLIVVLSKPEAWIKVVRVVYGNPQITAILSLIFAGITLFYLLAELTITQIFASMLFFMFLMAMGFAPFSKETLSLSEKILKDKSAIKRALHSIIIWTALVVWVLYALFI